MQEQSAELEALLIAVDQATIGITNQTCLMFNAADNSSFCEDICLFEGTDGKCKIRILKMANSAYRATLYKVQEVKSVIPEKFDLWGGNAACEEISGSPYEALE